MANLMKNDSYYIIYGWMLNELKLKSNELCIFAVIYGLSQNGGGKFTGSLQYLADCGGCTKTTALNCVKSLVEKNLIKKEEIFTNNVKYCNYTLNNEHSILKTMI